MKRINQDSSVRSAAPGVRGCRATRFEHSPPFKGGEFATYKQMSRSFLMWERTGWFLKNRAAHVIFSRLLTTPAAPKGTGPFLLKAQPPLLEKEGNGPQNNIVPKCWLSNSPLRPWLHSAAAPRLYKDALRASSDLILDRCGL
jgi:hypothetical protein